MPHPAPGEPSNRTKYLTLAAALLGWAFDGAEMGVFSLVGGPAMRDLLQGESPEAQGIWFGVVMAGFLVGAATGGVLFGWLGDRIGRVRAMTLSVFTYAFFTGVCGFSQEPWHLAVLRFVAALGMGGEWSLGVALVMEVWPNRSRAFMAGLIGAAANVGFLAVAVVGLGLLALLSRVENALAALGFAQMSIDWLVANQGWRIMMMLGTAPALLTFLIRLFVPESEKWQQEHATGSTKAWETRDLSAVLVALAGPALMIYVWSGPLSDAVSVGGSRLLAALGITVVGLAIAMVGYTFPVRRYLRRQAAMSTATDAEVLKKTLGRMMLGACLSGVALIGTWGLTQWIPRWADQMNTIDSIPAKEYAGIVTAVGAILGTILAAMSGDWFGRRRAYCVLCLTSMASVWSMVFCTNGYGPTFLAFAFLVGATTASFYGWLPLYLPELFPTRVRATGQGFGFNFGRILAAVGVLQMGPLEALFKDKTTIAGIAIDGGFPRACIAMSFVYVIGMALIWLAPETRGKPLPD
ncbi:MAG: MFS transporter [Planctomycetota bacterium]|nr:MAG: MFS transporter [Planctomycetota bacterium]